MQEKTDGSNHDDAGDGSLGRDVALGLADRLGLDLVQHELVEHIAEKMHMQEGSVNRLRPVLGP